ncbi:hypothetical protein PHYPO_G00221460 [Pangasianodon hypophthalmus]|uniref:Uncharacterized protein n=1 Tax=Pangasianodon hypophthalmus TaxID=310915 RepID=A0A5N5NUJ6_PANHP|nr:hypothetical protein PHYPO_G00221460 [Pangasianodon hypophthalmus]
MDFSAGHLNPRSLGHNHSIQRPIATVVPQPRTILQTTQVEDIPIISDDESSTSDVSNAKDDGNIEQEEEKKKKITSEKSIMN